MTRVRRPPGARPPLGKARPTTRRVGGLAGLVALGTAAGAALLATGTVRLDPDAAARLPAGSPLTAGLAVALVVALPLTVTAVAGWRGSGRTGDLAVIAGAAVLGLVIASVRVTRGFSWVQPVCLVCGAALVVLGLLLPRRPDAGRR